MEEWIDNQCREKRKDMWRILEGKLRGRKGMGEEREGKKKETGMKGTGRQMGV